MTRLRCRSRVRRQVRLPVGPPPHQLQRALTSSFERLAALRTRERLAEGALLLRPRDRELAVDHEEGDAADSLGMSLVGIVKRDLRLARIGEKPLGLKA